MRLSILNELDINSINPYVQKFLAICYMQLVMKAYAVWIQEVYAVSNRTDTKYWYLGILISTLFLIVDLFNWVLRLWSIYRINRNE